MSNVVNTVKHSVSILNPMVCCADGTISLVSNEVSQELYNLYTSRCEESIEFHKFVRTYNNSFAFTSFGVKYDKKLCENQQGIYTFRVQGQVHHYINELIPTNSCPTYLQLYSMILNMS